MNQSTPFIKCKISKITLEELCFKTSNWNFKLSIMNGPTICLFILICVVIQDQVKSANSKDLELIHRPSTDFPGNGIINIVLTNATINWHLQHLGNEVKSKQSECASGAHGTCVVTINHRGSLILNVKFDKVKQTLKTSGISSESQIIGVFISI
jgi:hypothetical protein